MQSPAASTSFTNAPPSLRSRLTSLVLSGTIVLLIVLVLLRLGMIERNTAPGGSRLVAVDVGAAETASQKTETHKAAAAATRPHVRLPQDVPTPVPPTPPIKLLGLSKDQFAAWDISKMPRQGGSADSAPAGGGKMFGPGEGPGGAQLFNAEWYREPSDAELSGYLRGGAPPGSWAIIACQTIEKMHVDNCQSLGESPPGSGLARSLRLAAWQFLVRPPRLNGKPMIGAWVRIRFDFTKARREVTPVLEDPDAPDEAEGR